ncbi:nucleoside diphosphate kinase homolog 5 [Anabrus simplex]|uniref:nucleoside diphosphate kinase homolog 5 n=1 Tax=Anabrus simplex TaxID=316456 RepID=UPI0034DD6FF6
MESVIFNPLSEDHLDDRELEAPPPSLESVKPSDVTDSDDLIHEELERTLALVKPEAVRYYNKILEKIIEEGFMILETRKVFLTPEQVSELYADHYGQLYFPLLVTHMSSGPIYALCLAKKNAIEDWKRIMGPKSPKEAIIEYPECLRAKYGDLHEDIMNAVHGSDCARSAEREIHFFFPEMVLEPLLTGEASKDYLAGKVNPTLLQGLSVLCQVKPVDPVIWLADWLLMNNPNKPRTDEAVATTPT